MVTLRFDNPFHDLWVTENLDPAAYVRMFSPVLVRDAEALFSTGNIVLKGRQGSGKSMLLNLLETSTRIAYAKYGDGSYPVPEKQRRFISAGVHLAQQNSSLIAARAPLLPPETRQQIIAANFADYLNALLCHDILKNVKELHEFQTKHRTLISEVPVDLRPATLDRFLSLLPRCESWRGVISDEQESIEEVIEVLDERLRAHRQYANGNIETLPSELEQSRAAAGTPIGELAVALRDSGVLPSETLFLIRIDQHEELFQLEEHSGLGHIFRQVVNAALSRRDPRVAYRIGTRHYAWDKDLTAWGSGVPLEQERDYSVVDLDGILRRKEHTKGWKFPALARDVFERRLSAAGFTSGDAPMSEMFGATLEPAERARIYAGKVKCVIRSDDTWAQEWRTYLEWLWDNEMPLDAKFGEAWLRQIAQRRAKVPQNGTLARDLPWRKSLWWIKERNEIALMQIAGERKQAMIWSGERHVIDLAGQNILAFMTICKCIWATWQRRNAAEAEQRPTLPRFSTDDQAIGILEASHLWFKKIQVGIDADSRSRLITALGSWFRQRMLLDQSLSYPGHSGFSLLSTDMLIASDLVTTIKGCSDRGDLLESAHTTKHSDQAPRLKWHLHPLLCPRFRIPHIRTKEPIYTTLNELQALISSQGRQAPVVDEEIGPIQLGLPGV